MQGNVVSSTVLQMMGTALVASKQQAGIDLVLSTASGQIGRLTMDFGDIAFERGGEFLEVVEVGLLCRARSQGFASIAFTAYRFLYR